MLVQRSFRIREPSGSVQSPSDAIVLLHVQADAVCSCPVQQFGHERPAVSAPAMNGADDEFGQMLSPVWFFNDLPERDH